RVPPPAESAGSLQHPSPCGHAQRVAALDVPAPSLSTPALTGRASRRLSTPLQCQPMPETKTFAPNSSVARPATPQPLPAETCEPPRRSPPVPLLLPGCDNGRP